MERSLLIPRGWNNTYVQREDFTIRVQHIIEGYGGGGTALKEMVGNSDDARAAEFVVFIDGSQYSRPEPPWQNMVSDPQGVVLGLFKKVTLTAFGTYRNFCQTAADICRPHGRGLHYWYGTVQSSHGKTGST